MPDKSGKRVKKILAANQDFMMRGLDVVGDGARVRKLAVGLLAVTDRKRFDGLAANFRHERRHCARVEASAEKYAQRHIAHQVAADGAFQKFTVRFDVVMLVAISVVGSGGQIPVLLNGYMTVLPHLEPVAGHQLLDAAVKSRIRRKIAKGEKLGQAGPVELGTIAGKSQHNLDFGAEHQIVGRQAVVKRLDSEPVASDEKSFALRVPDSKGKHSAQVLHTILAVLLVKMNDGLCIALRTVTVAASDQLLPQSAVVVDFAVEDDHDGAVFVADRLMAGGEVDDAQAAHAQTHAALGEDAVVVGAAMGHDVAHALQYGAVRVRLLPEFENPCDAAHDRSRL